MSNPFKSVISVTDTEHYFYQTNCKARLVISAAGRTDSYAREILDMACEMMDRNNECTVTYAELDKDLGIKQTRTRTKSINILRMLKLIETTNGNKKGVVLFRVNARAFSKTSLRLKDNDSRFCEELNAEMVGSDGKVIQAYIDTYRYYEKNQEKVERHDGLPF
ncbi:hypothetical protein ALQ37_200192 [Pseudomonas syringae pv. aptata]|uniref:Plasmid replication protein RepL domain-containing protein n=1 Tax=Pseudomonas syringae pv. aptata TaxID=83167 RepID=A0A3M3X784_PSEAP|nr:hypothetical protein [Pseudomonas syringae]RMO65434.1 hypothetical protein ALQ37_200192 [Pseudomonas syringae pv. aptata]